MADNDIWLPWIDQKVCTGCGDCVSVCPVDVLALTNDKASVCKPQMCNYCGLCETICPSGAIALPYQIILKIDP